MADILFDGPDAERVNQLAKRLAKALDRAGLESIKLADLVAAVIANALARCDGDRDRAARLLGMTPEQLALKLDGPHNGELE